MQGPLKVDGPVQKHGAYHCRQWSGMMIFAVETIYELSLRTLAEIACRHR